MKHSLIFTFIFIYSVSGFGQASLSPTLSMENRDGYSIPFQHGYNTSVPMSGFEKQNRRTIELAGTWKHKRFSLSHDFSLENRNNGGLTDITNESGGIYKPKYNDLSWEDFELPMVENKMHYHVTLNPITNLNDTVPELQYDENSDFYGGVWYRRHFQVLPGTGPGYCKLVFYAVCYTCDVWLNGQYIGYHEGGYSSFSFDVTDAINLDPNGDNVIAVRVDNPPTYDPKQPTSTIRNDIIPCSNANAWTNYTGIIHDVYIEVSNFISTARADIVPLDISGNIKTTVTVFNRHSLPTNTVNTLNVNIILEVYNAAINSGNWKTEVASDLISNSTPPVSTSQTSITISELQTKVIQVNMNIPNPNLWYPAKTGVPYSNLYVLKVRLIDPLTGLDIDSYYTQFGIRKLENSMHQTLINGEASFLTGVGRVEEHPDKGRSVTHEIIENDLMMIKDVFKCNWLRTATFPNDPYTYLLADRLGLAVMEEIPLFQFPQAAWQIQQSDVGAREIHYQMFREMIYRDYNRPSIFFWGTANENSVTNNDYENEFVMNLKNELNLFGNEDGRFIVQAANSCNIFNDINNCGQDPSQSTCDVAGWTMYTPCGGGGQCQMYLDQFLDQEHTYLPTKSIFSAEFGAVIDDTTATSKLSTFVARAPFNINGFNCGGFVSAITYWAAFDFYCSMTWAGQDPLGHVEPYGLASRYRGFPDPNQHRVTQIIEQYYSPYFDVGGLYNGGVPCDQLNSKTNQRTPFKYSLSQNYPNPFNPNTKIYYEIAKDENVRIAVYDVLGRLVMSLVNDYKKAGNYSVDFDGTNLASGLYIYEIKTSNFSKVKKMLLIK